MGLYNSRFCIVLITGADTFWNPAIHSHCKHEARYFPLSADIIVDFLRMARDLASKENLLALALMFTSGHNACCFLLYRWVAGVSSW
jgi:hypothetical protein